MRQVRGMRWRSNLNPFKSKGPVRSTVTTTKREPTVTYELWISRASPYSSKAHAQAGYAGIEFHVQIPNAVTRWSVIRRLTGKTMVPVLRRGKWAINDSTRIAQYLVERSKRPMLPQRPADLLAWLFEDFADEWVVRCAMHSRWRHLEDTQAIEAVIGEELTGVLPVGKRLLGGEAARRIQAQLQPWGITPANDEAMEESMFRLLEALEALLGDHGPYLFGGYPTVADFALYGALIQYRGDPTGRQRLRGHLALHDYLDRIDAMTSRPATIEVEDCAPVDIDALGPLFGEMMGTYWTLLVANQRSLDAGSDDVACRFVDGHRFQAAASRYLSRRMEALLQRVNETYAQKDNLFGSKGLRMERALIDGVAELCDTEGGRQLLRRFEYLGMH